MKKVTTAVTFIVGEFYSNTEIMRLGGGPMDFLPFKNGRVVAGRFTEKKNPGLPTTLLIGKRDRVLGSAMMFRGQSEFVPIFIKPMQVPRDSRKWRFEGHWRVANRTPDSVKDAEEVQVATARWRQDREISLVLHLERQQTIGDDDLLRAEQHVAAEGAFDPTDQMDARERMDWLGRVRSGLTPPSNAPKRTTGSQGRFPTRKS